MQQPMLNTAIRAARSAGDPILRSADKVGSLHIDQKGRNDYASEVDRMAEREIINIIKLPILNTPFWQKKAENIRVMIMFGSLIH